MLFATKYFVAWSSIAIIFLGANAVNAKSHSEIEQISRRTAVKISTQSSKENGSGFILQRQGDLYTIATNRHVICMKVQDCTQPLSGNVYNIETADGQKHQARSSQAKILGKDLDLGIIQFRSNNNYLVAQLNTTNIFEADDVVYVGGFPASESSFRFSDGQALAAVNKRMASDGGGYTVIYDAYTLPGMSGSAVFNQSGQVVAIHGQGDRYRSGTDSASTNYGSEDGVKIGTNRGIPVNHLLAELQTLGIKLSGQQLAMSNQNSAAQAEEYLVSGYNRWIYADSNTDKNAAIQLYGKAIELNPKQAKAYLMRGYTYLQLGDQNKAIENYSAAIQADPKYGFAYFLRGVLKATKLKDLLGAIADYDQAIAFKPKLVTAHSNRCIAKSSIGNPQGALPDCNRAIEINPKMSVLYIQRSSVRLKLQDYQGALADNIQAIQLNPQDVMARFHLGLLKRYPLNDRAGAIKEFQLAKELYIEQSIKSDELLQFINTQLKELGVNE